MPFSASPLQLTSEERDTLTGWVRAGKTESRLAERAKIILMAADGVPTRQIAGKLATRWARVSKWRRRFAQQRLGGLIDGPRPGKPTRYDKATERRILERLDQPPPEGYSQWNGPRLAEALGDVSRHQVWRVLRRYDICLERRRSWCVSTDPEFGPKAADIVGLYLNPPENALVLCVDEKPSIQVLERAQGWLRLPNGKALTGFSHGYKRHGTTTLFAALDIATGQVRVGHFHRRRRREFLEFMNGIVKDHPGQQIHVIVDNLNTHKPKRDRWLAQHPNVHFHFTPTYSSWLNQVEVWFSILVEQALKNLSLTRAKELREAIDRFVKVYNPKAAPFEWTKAVVHPVEFKRRYADLCN